MERFNRGQRSQPAPRQPSIYEQTYKPKLATLRSFAAHIEGPSVIDENFFQPTLRTSHIQARCAWNSSDAVTLTLHNLTPEQAILALEAIKDEP